VLILISLLPLDDLPSAATVAADCTDDSISWLTLSLRIDGPSSSSRVGVVGDMIQYRIAESGLADNLMPSWHGELASDEEGTAGHGDPRRFP
jgi:hypothetical protein